VVATASFNVASILREGIGVEKDLERSIKYYKKAASLGEANASYILGVLSHQDGDLEQAHSCFLTAAHLGHLDSQVNVAANYLYGEIVMQNNELAYYWAKIASNQGDAESKKIISAAETLLNRNQIERLDEAVMNF
jgi:TPR repeat protein